MRVYQSTGGSGDSRMADESMPSGAAEGTTADDLD